MPVEIDLGELGETENRAQEQAESQGRARCAHAGGGMPSWWMTVMAISGTAGVRAE